MLTNQSRFLVRSALKLIGALSVSLMLAESALAGKIFTWDPSVAGLNGTAFTGDALKATEVSHIVFTGPSTWTEHGYAKITGILNNGVFSVPTGLNTTYTLYVDFSGTGDLAAGTFATANETLYGVNGVSVFGFEANNDAKVTNFGSLVELATNSLIKGITLGGVGSDLGAELWTVFTPTAGKESVFLSPVLPAQFYGNFFHPLSEPGGVTFVSDGIKLALRALAR